MSQRRFVNFGADANASTVKTINSILAAPQVLRATAPFFQASAPDQLVVRPHSVIFESGMLLDEDETLAFTVPTSFSAADYTLLYEHIDEDIIGGTAATIELRGGLLDAVPNTVILGWVRYPGGSVQLDPTMLFPNRTGQLQPGRMTHEVYRDGQVISQDPDVTLTTGPTMLAQTIPGIPYQVTLGATHVSRLLADADQRVRIYDHTNGGGMTRISAGTPATTEFLLDSPTGVATFAAPDAGNRIDISDVTYGGYRLATNGSATEAAVVDTLYSFAVIEQPLSAITAEYIPLATGYAVSLVEAFDIDGTALTTASSTVSPTTADGTAARLVARLTDGIRAGTAGQFITVRLRETLPASASGLLLRVRATTYDLPF